MPQAGNIVISDGATTPVAHTFTPIGKDSNGVIWWEQITPVPTTPLGAKRIGYKQTRAMDAKKRETGVSQASWSLHVPTLETLSTNDAGLLPPATLAYKEVARFNFDLAERSTKQERRDTRVLSLNLLSALMTQFAIDELQPTYAG